MACAGGDGERAAKPSSQPNNETVDSVGKNESSKESHIPQARPFLLLLEAVKMRDEHKLKTVHSERIKEGLEKKGWASVLKE